MYSRLRVVSFGVLLVGTFALSMAVSSHAFAATHTAKQDINGQFQKTSGGFGYQEGTFVHNANSGNSLYTSQAAFGVKNTAIGYHNNVVNNNVVAKQAVVGQNVAIGKVAIIAHTINVNKTVINNYYITHNYTRTVYVQRSYAVRYWRSYHRCCCHCSRCCRW